MQLALLGASSGTGLAVIAEAARRGTPRIRGLYRPAAGQPPAPAGVAVVIGDPTDDGALRRTLDGCGAALVLLGPRAPYTDVFCARATARLVVAMEAAGVRRLVVQTGAMVGRDHAHLTRPMAAMAALFASQRPEVADDRAAQEDVVRGSGLDWTLVKPPRLTDEARATALRAAPDLTLGLRARVARRALARWLLDEVEAGRWVGSAVRVRDA